VRGRPAAEALLDERDRVVRVDVADEGEDRAARHEARGRAGRGRPRLDGGDVRARRHLPRDGVGAEPLALQRLRAIVRGWAGRR
jgi:hypothetical protein